MFLLGSRPTIYNKCAMLKVFISFHGAMTLFNIGFLDLHCSFHLLVCFYLYLECYIVKKLNAATLGMLMLFLGVTHLPEGFWSTGLDNYVYSFVN